MSDTRPPILIPGNLKGSVPRHIVAKTDYIYDDPWDKTQREINEEFDQRITDIQELAEISIEGGDIQIATSADFIEPISAESRAKIPTVGAIVDGYILAETGNANRPVFINRNHKPEVVTGIDVPEDIHSDKNIEASWGVSAHGHADMSIGGGGSDSDSVKAIKVGEGGSPITPDNGIVTLPPYPSTLAELTPDSQHQTVTSSEKEDWNDILDKIPAEATSSNKLADKNYVDTQMASASGTFRGTNTTATTEQELIAWANTLQHNVNDYVFWQKSDAYGNTYFSRYKYDGTTWLYEYDITSTSFTEEQWNAINSGITQRIVTETTLAVADHETRITNVESNVQLISQRLDYDSLPLFDANKQGGYIRGDVVKIVDSGGNAFGYRFIMSHTGAWVEAHTEPLNIWALANPLDIDDTRLNEIINS